MTEELKELRVVVGVPSGGTWYAQFGMCLMNMVLMMQNPPEGCTIQTRIHNTRGSILPRSRQNIIDRALRSGATHVLFVDSDQTFPAETFHQLYSHGKPVVAANIPTKSLPANTTARVKSDDPWGMEVITGAEDVSLEAVWRVGTGVMLIDLEIFEWVDWPQPIFTQEWAEEIQDYHGEDWGFCKWLESCGIPIFVDHALSNTIGHIGELVYTHDAVGAGK